MPSRRELLTGIAAALTATAGCLGGDEYIAQCSSRGEGGGSQHLRRIAPIQGSEQIALGILVSERAVSNEQYDTIRIRNSDGTLVASVPLLSDRDMSRLDPDDYSVFASSSGELYAVPLGPPPVHGEYTVSLTGQNAEAVETSSLRFNCYADDADGLP